MSKLDHLATRYYAPTESLSEWVEEKECRALVVNDAEPWNSQVCQFIGEVDCWIMPGTGRAVEWTCEVCGTEHFEEEV